jgi:immune inhibitor A
MRQLQRRLIVTFTHALLLIALLPPVAPAQMPPHPRMKELLRRGEIDMPYVLQHLPEVRAQGVDGAWAAPAVRDQVQAAPGGTRPARVLGPSLAPTGSWRALVILVDFSDKTSNVAAGSFDNLLFGSSAGTMRHYYNAVSYGALDIVTVHLPGTIGWKRAPQTYAYYCNAQNGFGNYPRNAQKLTEDAVTVANASVDFSQYDNDGDGYVDALFIVHSGPGAEYTGLDTDIWSHAWSTKTAITLDGVKVFRYSMEPEYWESPGDMTMGVYAHELGHAAFGLPDLYDTDYTSAGLDSWSLMAGGSWNGPAPGGASPAFPDVWSHTQMGYVAPTTIAANTSGASLHQITDLPNAWKLWSGGAPGTQYFMVENRQRTGYDAYLQGDGMLVYHVDESVLTDNDNEWYPGHTTSGHYLVALEQADGQWNLEQNVSADGADPFPGTGNKRTFAGTTTPDTKSYASALTGVALRNISASGSTMTADLEIDDTAPGLTIVSPYGGESLIPGDTYAIQWSSRNLTGTVSLSYSTNNGSSWQPISTVSLAAALRTGANTADTYAPVSETAGMQAAPAAGAGSYAWTVPNSPATQCLVRVISDAIPALTDQSDGVFRILTPVSGQWTVQFNYDAASVTGINGNAAVVYLPDRQEFWTARWATNLLHRWTSTGTLIQEFSVAGVTGVRGMTFDGTYIYAGQNTTTIAVIDPNTRTQVSTITAPVTVRYIAFDPTADSGQGGFWVGAYTTAVYLISRTGTTLRTLAYASLNSTSNFGAAYDPYSAGGPFLWLFGQGAGSGTPQRIVQIDLATGLPTGVEHDVLTDVGGAVLSPVAGGLFIVPGFAPHAVTLGGIIQGTNDHLFGYYIAPLPSASVKAELQGAYNAPTARMRTSLRTRGILSARFPGIRSPRWPWTASRSRSAMQPRWPPRRCVRSLRHGSSRMDRSGRSRIRHWRTWILPLLRAAITSLCATAIMSPS